MSGHPYRDAPAKASEPTRYPFVRLSDAKNRLIQVAEDGYTIEKLTETTDSLGNKVSYWTPVQEIKKPEKSLRVDLSEMYSEHAKVPAGWVLWILRNL